MKFVKSVMAVCGMILFVSGCSQKTDYVLLQSENEIMSEKVVPNQKIEYRILPQDRLSITVYKYPELTPSSMRSEGILVDSNGDVYLPLIHKVRVAGMTQSQATRVIEKRYGKYLTDPALHLEVMNKRIYVLGEVKKPGVVKLDKEKLTILEALAFAGDLTDAAVRENIVVVSHNAKNQMSIRKIDITNFDLLSRSNIILKPNDIVYVQPSGWKEFRVASNDVLSPLNPIVKIAGAYATFKYLAD